MIMGPKQIYSKAHNYLYIGEVRNLASEEEAFCVFLNPPIFELYCKI